MPGPAFGRRTFKHLRENGEWFRPERDLLDSIADIGGGATA